MPNTERYRVLVERTIPPLGRCREGTEVELTESAARYPLLRRWIEPAPPPPPPSPEPEPPKPPRRRSRG